MPDKRIVHAKDRLKGAETNMASVYRVVRSHCKHEEVIQYGISYDIDGPLKQEYRECPECLLSEKGEIKEYEWVASPKDNYSPPPKTELGTKKGRSVKVLDDRLVKWFKK